MNPEETPRTQELSRLKQHVVESIRDYGDKLDRIEALFGETHPPSSPDGWLRRNLLALLALIVSVLVSLVAVPISAGKLYLRLHDVENWREQHRIKNAHDGQEDENKEFRDRILRLEERAKHDDGRDR